MPKKQTKPNKPRKNFPLYAHNRGYWAKKILNKVYYFGRWEDPKGAEEEYDRQKNDLYAGIKPSPKCAKSNTLLEACNLFLHEKELKAEKGKIRKQAWQEHKRSCGRIMRAIGETKIVSQITPFDMSKVQEALTDNVAPTTEKGRIGQARTFFNWLYKMEMIDRELSNKLELPEKDKIRRARQAKPPKLFTQKEILAFHKAATGHMKPAILLGINAALGNHDIVKLRWDMISPDGWLTFPRPKTAILRRCKLWPETIKALKDWRKIAPECEYVACDPKGRQFSKGGSNSPLANQFKKVAENTTVVRNGRGFYCLRHTFRTVGDEVRDTQAARRIMGHETHSIDAEYLKGLSDDRLVAVSEYVRQWLYKKAKQSSSGSQ